MRLELRTREQTHVELYYEKTQDDEIKNMLPSAARSLEQAVEMYKASLLPDSTSFGKVIYYEGEYIGDIWCYSIDREDSSAMLSFCIFEKSLWGKGIATLAVKLFLPEVFERYSPEKIGAFTFAENIGSVKVLKKAGFTELEEFEEDGVLSKYMEISKEKVRES